MRENMVIQDDRYYKQLNYEAAIAQQINRVADAVSKHDVTGMTHTITTLAHMLPTERRKKALTLMEKTGLSYTIVNPNDVINKWLELWDYCTDQLKEANLIFREGKGPGEFGTM